MEVSVGTILEVEDGPKREELGNAFIAIRRTFFGIDGDVFSARITSIGWHPNGGFEITGVGSFGKGLPKFRFKGQYGDTYTKGKFEVTETSLGPSE